MPKQPIITDASPPSPPRSAASQTRSPSRKKPPKKPRAKPPAKNPNAGRLTIATVPITQINPAPYNPRKALKPGDDEYARLKRSIETFAYVDPLIWNKRTGNLVGGHQRLAVLTNEFGITEVDVSVVDLDDNAEKSLNVALNKIDGEWDDDGLAALLMDLQSADYDATLTGFDENEIDAMLADLDASAAAGSVDTPVDREVKSVREIIIQCETEAEQNELFTDLKKRGITCRMSVLL